MRRWHRTWLRCSGSTCTSFDIHSTSREHSRSLWVKAGKWLWSTRPRTKTSRSSKEGHKQPWFDRHETLGTTKFCFFSFSQRHIGDIFGIISFYNTSFLLMCCQPQCHIMCTHIPFFEWMWKVMEKNRLTTFSTNKLFRALHERVCMLKYCLSVILKQTWAKACQITTFHCIPGCGLNTQTEFESGQLIKDPERAKQEVVI